MDQEDPTLNLDDKALGNLIGALHCNASTTLTNPSASAQPSAPFSPRAAAAAAAAAY